MPKANRIIMLVWTLLLAGPASAQADRDLSRKIDALVRPHADSELFSGAILVATGESVLAEAAYGYANWELGVPNERDTRFAIGSITKSFTANIVSALVDQGQLVLDAPVERYLERFPRGPDGGIATIEHLLTHRAGVPHRVTTLLEESLRLEAGDVVDRIRQSELAFDPGSERLYSSAGYTALARAMERASGQSFAALLQRHVFDPAGMQTAMDETGGRLMRRRALSYRLGVVDGNLAVKSSPHRNLGFLTGAGSVYATAMDVYRYVLAVRSGIFGDAARAELTVKPDSWQGIYGRTNNYEASVDFHAGREIVVVILSNLQSISTSQVRSGIREILLAGSAEALPMPPRPVPLFESGESISGSYGRAVIMARGDELFRGENEFYPVEGQAYYIPGSGTTMTFRRNEDGIVDTLVSVSAGGRESLLPRTD